MLRAKLPLIVAAAMALLFLFSLSAAAVVSVTAPTDPVSDGGIVSTSFDADGYHNAWIAISTDGGLSWTAIDGGAVAGLPNPLSWAVADYSFGITSTNCMLLIQADSGGEPMEAVSEPFMIDNGGTPPAFDSGPTVDPPSWTNGTGVDVAWSASDDDGIVDAEYELDGGDYTPGASGDTIDVNGLADGVHVLDVMLIDGVGDINHKSVNVYIDTTNPTCNIGAPSKTVMKTPSAVTFPITYADATSPLTVNLWSPDITVDTTGGTVTHGAVGIVGGDTDHPEVTVWVTGGNGPLKILVAAGKASDGAGNTDPGDATSATVTVDSIPPTIAIGEPSAAATSAGPITYLITYGGADAITLANDDVTLNKTGTADGALDVTVSSPTTRLVTISGITGDGTLGISVGAGTANDTAGNPAPAAGPSTTFIVNNAAPLSVSIGAPSVSLAAGGPVTYTVTYTGADAVTLANADVTLNKTGTADGTVDVTGAGTDTRTVTISGITGDGTLGISLAAGTATDAGSNPADAAGPSTTFEVYNTALSVTIGAPSAPLTKAGPVSYTVTYVGADHGAGNITLDNAQVTLNATGNANGAVNVTGAGNTRTVTISGITGDGTLGISLVGGTAHDAFGNPAGPEGPSALFTVDNTAPTVSIGAPSAAATKGGPITYTVTYGSADTVTLANANVTLNTTGTANGTVNVTGAGTATRTVTISAITGDGTLGISLAAATASDTIGNTALAAGPSATFNVDNTAPTVSIGAPSAAATKGGPVTYTITYGSADTVTLANANVTLNTTGTANGTVNVTGAGTATRTVTISAITGDGTLGISLAAATASDTAGNTALGAGPSTTFAVDNTAPTVAIDAPSVPLTDTGPVSFTITYVGADAVTLANANVTLNTTGTANGTVNVTGAGTDTRTVTISAITGDGTIGISIAAATASDTAGNSALGAGPSTTFTVDNTAPTVSIGAPSAALTKAGPITYTITYAGANAVTLANTNVTLHTSGTANGTVNVTGGGLVTRTVTISGITGDGTLGVSIASDTASDTAGNTALGAGPSATFTVDNTAPTVSIGAPSPGVLTHGGPVTYTITYGGADAVTLANADVTLNKTGTADGAVNVTGAGTTTRTVTISGITGDGTLDISIAAGTASDTAGNTALGAGPSATLTVDNTPPTILISAPSAAVTNTGPVTYTITYGGANAVTLANADVTLNKTLTADGTVNVTGAGTTTRTVTISGITGDGALGISIAGATASDAVGNGAPAAGPSTAFVVDNVAPSVSIGTPSVSLTRAGPVTFLIAYGGADAVTLANANITLNKTGTANGTVSVSTPSQGAPGTGGRAKIIKVAAPTPRIVTISGITGDGTLGISIAAGTASDAAGNTAPAAGPSTTFTVDNTAPTISIGAPSAALTQGGPVTYTITYGGADAVALANANVTLNKTGTADGTVNVTGAGLTNRTVTISGITGTGTLGISIVAATASDNAGNNALAAGPSTTFAVDNTAPTVSISAPSAATTVSGPITYTITYAGADAVTLANADVTLNKTGTANGTVNVTGAGTATRTVTISGITGTGTLGISLAAATASDAAGNNALGAGPSGTFTVTAVSDSIPPTVSIALQVNKGNGVWVAVDEPILWRNRGYSYRVVWDAADETGLAASAVRARIGGGAWIDITGSKTGTALDLNTLSGGVDVENFQVEVYARDNGGNVTELGALNPTGGTLFGVYDVNNLGLPTVKIMTPANGTLLVPGMQITIKVQVTTGAFHVPGSPNTTYKADASRYWMHPTAQGCPTKLRWYIPTTAAKGIPKSLAAGMSGDIALPTATVTLAKDVGVTVLAGNAANRKVTYEWAQKITLVRGAPRAGHPEEVKVDPSLVYQVEVPYSSVINLDLLQPAAKPGPVPATEPLGTYLLQREFARFWIWSF
jgi:hypothetical protein